MTEEIKQWIEREAEKKHIPHPSEYDARHSWTIRKEGFIEGAIALYEKLIEQHRQEIESWKKRLSDCEDMNQKMGREGKIL